MNKKRAHIIPIIILLLLSSWETCGQDVQFAQFYSIPTYQNPAFAGSAHYDRVSLHQRVQWPGLDAKYLTSLVSFDRFYKKYKSGIGGYLLHDRIGSDAIISNEIQLQYSYQLHLTSEIVIRSGLQLGFVTKKLDPSLTYPGQYSNEGFVGGPDPLGDQNRITKNYFDIGAGAVAFTNSVWLGFSVNHLNQPNTSFSDEFAGVPLRWTLISGYKYIINKRGNGLAKGGDELSEISITPTLHYKFQGKSDQADLGLYGVYKKYIIGVWYRGIPFKIWSNEFPNNESIVFLGGYRTNRLGISYSYGQVVSTLNDVRNIGGHEINLTYIIRPLQAKKPTKRMPCPKFFVH